jgi:hypothetical protein
MPADDLMVSASALDDVNNIKNRITIRVVDSVRTPEMHIQTIM